MVKRPIPVTIIAWCLLICATVIAVCMTFILVIFSSGLPRSVISVPAVSAIILPCAAATLLIGIGLLRGRDWARILFVVVNGFGPALGLIGAPADGITMVLAVTVTGMLYLFFSTRANAFFAAKKASS